MEWINYHHLLYFWVVGRRGSISKACEELSLSQPTISGQLRTFEDYLGERLFTRSGRGLKLTEFGTLMFRYADEIFSLGRELTDVIKGRPSRGITTLKVGIAQAMPKLVAFRLIEPALHLGQPIRVICREDKTEKLLQDLATSTLDFVLSDAPAGPGANVRLFNHLLGESSVSFFASPKVVSRYRRTFPKSLDGVPVLLPAEGSMVRRSLEKWFDSTGIRPVIIGEFDDTALMKILGQAAIGLFPGPSVIEGELQRMYQVRSVGRIDAVKEQFYVISAERRIRHPATAAICESARRDLFA